VGVSVIFLFLLVAVPLGITLLLLGARGAPVLSEPRCAKCGYDLRGFAQTAPTRCSECGADLQAPRAVRWGEFRKRPRFVWAGLALLGLPVVMLTAAIMSRTSMAPTATLRSNASMLSSLATSVNQPSDWRELDNRLAAGKLSNAEVAQAVNLLIADLSKANNPYHGPLTWSEGFVSRADSAGALSDEQYLRLARAFYGPGKVDIASHVRQGSQVPFTLHYGGSWHLPNVQLVKALRQVKSSDGSVIAARADDDARRQRKGQETPPNADYLSAESPWDINGALATQDLQPGEHQLTFTIDAGALLPQTAPRAVQTKPGQAKNWPTGRAKWSEDISVPLTVMPVGKSPVSLVTDPALDPSVTGAIKVKAIRVIRSGAGQRATADIAIDGSAVPCSFDVFLRVVGVEYPIGYHVARRNGSMSTDHSHDFPSLPADVKAADLIFRPNPAHAEGVAGIDRVWGGTVELPNQRLQRYDLEAPAASQPASQPTPPLNPLSKSTGPPETC